MALIPYALGRTLSAADHMQPRGNLESEVASVAPDISMA